MAKLKCRFMRHLVRFPCVILFKEESVLRKDIYEGVLPFIMTHTKPNYAALAKQYNCDYRTVNRYYEEYSFISMG